MRHSLRGLHTRVLQHETTANGSPHEVHTFNTMAVDLSRPLASIQETLPNPWFLVVKWGGWWAAEMGVSSRNYAVAHDKARCLNVQSSLTLTVKPSSKGLCTRVLQRETTANCFQPLPGFASSPTSQNGRCFIYQRESHPVHMILRLSPTHTDTSGSILNHTDFGSFRVFQPRPGDHHN